MNNALNILNMIKANPMKVLSQRYNIPSNININNPNDVIQHLLNTGQVSQQQVDQIMQLKNNKQLRNMFGI